MPTRLQREHVAEHVSLPMRLQPGQARPFERVYLTMSGGEVLDRWRQLNPTGHMPAKLRNAVGFLLILEAHGRDHAVARASRATWKRHAERLAEYGCMRVEP